MSADPSTAPAGPLPAGPLPGSPFPASHNRVCVVGGGLAGIAAAVRLAEAGARVMLFEIRRDLGGATYSFTRDGLTVDTGQHVFLRCYTAYRRLLRRLGTNGDTHVQDRFTVPVLVPGQRPHLLRRTGLPAPAHLLPTLLSYRLLTLGERLRALGAAAALRGVDPDDPAVDEASFGGWLAAHGQRDRAVRRLWDLVIIPALNLPAADASLALAARVFRTGLLDDPSGGDIGRPLVSLLDLHGAPARRLLQRLGVRLALRTRVTWIRADGGGLRVGAGDAETDADAVVLAVPHPAAARLVPAAAAPRAVDWQRLGASPIVNVHLRYAATVTDLPFVAAVDSPAQWVFDRSTDQLGGEQHLVVSLSAADAEIGRPAAELIEVQRRALAALFPLAADTPVRDAFVTRHPYATFRQAPGTRVLRPAAATAVPGLALAGAWIDTGWPDTMEGAVRSGEQAADVVARHLVSRPRHTEAAR